MTLPTTVLALGPKAYWQCDELTNTNLADSSGNGRTASRVGTATQMQPSLLGTGEGYSRLITGRCTAFYNSWQDFQYISMWMRYQPRTADLSGTKPFASRRPFSIGSAVWTWGLSGGILTATVFTPLGSMAVSGGTTLVAGTNYSVAFTYDGVDLKVWLNGVVDGSEPWADTGLNITASDLDINRTNEGTTGGGYYDEIALFDYALDSTEMATLHAAAISTVAERAGASTLVNTLDLVAEPAAVPVDYAGVAALTGETTLTAGGTTVPVTASLASSLTLVAGGVKYGPGSFLAPYVTTSPASVNFATASDTATPAADQGDAGAVDIWYRIESTSVSTLTLTWTGSAAVAFELWLVPSDVPLADPDDATFLASDLGPTMTFPTGEGQVYFARVHPMDDADNAATGTLTWAFSARVSGALLLLCDPVAYDDPAELRVSVLSATDEGDVEFRIDGVLVMTEAADDSGQIVGMTIPTEGLSAGSHTMVATDVVSGQSDSAGFSVVLFTAEPSADPPPATPVTPATGDVIRWVFEMPAPDVGVSYTFPNNPSDMTTPHAARVLNPEFTVSPNGQPIVFEGEPTPVEWTASGFCFDEAHFSALETWLAYNRRFFVIDHLERVWVCTLEDVAWEPVRDPQHPWAHRYRMKFLIYDGPLELVT